MRFLQFGWQGNLCGLRFLEFGWQGSLCELRFLEFGFLHWKSINFAYSYVFQARDLFLQLGDLLPVTFWTDLFEVFLARAYALPGRTRWMMTLMTYISMLDWIRC